MQPIIPQYTQDIYNRLKYVEEQMDGQGCDDDQRSAINCECKATTTDEALVYFSPYELFSLETPADIPRSNA